LPGSIAEADLAELGLRLEEVKRLTAALQAEIVTAQVATVGERCRWCAACGRMLASKGHYRATFRCKRGKFLGSAVALEAVA
jgi:tRNA(Ile2) C34 agmatinyltransferase TiaS